MPFISDKKMGMSLGVLGTLIACLTVPVRAIGQDQGYNTVFSSIGHTVTSPAFFDASMFIGTGSTKSTNICGAIYGILRGTFLTPPQTFTPGAVIDARGVSGATALTCPAGTSPWTNGTTPVTVPSTILLPATGGTNPTPIMVSTARILPSNTHLIGEGDGIPISGFTPGTTIQAVSPGFSGSMIQFGTSTCLPQPGVPSSCSGFTVERITLDGNGQSINGIANAYGADPSYVDHVSLYRILNIGLLVSGSATNSGPYSNVTFDTGGYAGNSSTVCAEINGLSATRGIHGLRCTSETHDAAAAVLLDSSNNSLEDISIVGFDDGILVGANAAAHSNVLVNVFGDTGTSGLPIHVVHISSNNSVSDISIVGVHNALTSQQQYTVADDLTSTYLLDSDVAIYALGESNSGGYSRFTTSPNAATWASGATTPSGGCTAANGGSLFSNTSSTGAALWVCRSGGGSWLSVPIH